MTTPSEKIKDMKEKLNKEKLDIVEVLAEKDEIFEPNTLIKLVWQLRGIVNTLKYLDD